MNKIQKKSDKLLIVVHEIYGINQHITDVCDLFSKQNFNIICPNLLEQEIPFDYSFNIDELILNLNKQNVDVHKCKGEHGFSDPYSPKYNIESAEFTFQKTLNFLRTNCDFIPHKGF